MVIVFGLCGNSGCGKDTVADFLQEEHGFYKVSFAAKIKEIISDLFPLGYNELYGDKRNTPSPVLNLKTPRDLLQQLGVLMRQFDEDVWANYIINKSINEVLINKLGAKKIVISDTRFISEINCMKRAFGNNFKTIKINRPIDKSDGLYTHVSETELQTIRDEEFDYIINNNGSLYKLYGMIDEMIGKLVS